MANGHVRPGQSVTWRNETGAPVRSGALVPFGGGIAAKALQDIPAGQEGVVTLFQVHRFPLPPGVTFRPGELVFVANGEISTSGDVLGRFIRLDEGGWAEVLIMPLAVGGGSGGSVPTLQQIADGEGGTSVIRRERIVGDKTENTETKIGSGSYSIKTSNDKDADYNELNVSNLSILMRARASNKLSSALLSPYQFALGNSQDALDITVNNLTDRCSVTCKGRMRDAFRTALGVDDTYTKAQTDERIAEALGTFDKLDYKVADSPPTPTTVVIDGKTETTQTGVRYMVKHATDDRYEEYILIDGKIYDIGSTGEIDLSAYATTAAMNTALAAKQDTLVSGTNIKRLENIDLIGGGTINVRTVNNESVLGTGNINTAKILYDTTDQTTVLSDTGSDVQIGINRVDDNTLNINETAPDSRGQSQTVYNMNLPTKGYVDEVKGTHLEVGAERWCGTYKEDGVTYQVYSKIIKIDALPNVAGITTYPHGITGIKQILSAYGSCTNGFVMNAPRQNAQDNIAIYQVSKTASNGTVSIEVGKDRSSIGAYVCLVYAKNN